MKLFQHNIAEYSLCEIHSTSGPSFLNNWDNCNYHRQRRQNFFPKRSVAFGEATPQKSRAAIDESERELFCIASREFQKSSLNDSCEKKRPIGQLANKIGMALTGTLTRS